MTRIIIILSLFLSLSFNQSRSAIFNTGSPAGTEGYLIDSTHSIANQFSVQNQHVLEAMVFYVSPQSPIANIIVSIKEDNNGIPGQIISDLALWEFSLNPLNSSNYNLIVTTDLCLYLSKDTSYWWTIEAEDELTQATWIYSNNSTYTYSRTDDAGVTWNTSLGYAGAGGIWAEQIYENAILEGDVNFDFLLNIIDIVSFVGHVIGNNPFNQEQLDVADMNADSIINVVDIISLINLILASQSPNPNFELTDINPASQYYSQNIGPSFFDGQVSCYYFGKQG